MKVVPSPALLPLTAGLNRCVIVVGYQHSVQHPHPGKAALEHTVSWSWEAVAKPYPHRVAGRADPQARAIVTELAPVCYFK